MIVSNHKIINLTEPEDSHDAVTKNLTTNFLRKDGSNDVEGDINVNNHTIVNLSDPVDAQDATTKR